jgi:hypothetical protein
VMAMVPSQNAAAAAWIDVPVRGQGCAQVAIFRPVANIQNACETHTICRDHAESSRDEINVAT